MPSAPDGTFHAFPRLPTELRLKIWQFSIRPRTVALRDKVHHDKNERYLISPTPPPAIMQACRESRSEAQSSGLYEAACVNVAVGPHYIWIDFAHDTVRFGHNQIGLIKEEERAKIRKAIFEVEDSEVFLQFNLGENMNSMGALRELDLLSKPPLWSWGRNFGWVQAKFAQEFGTQIGWEPPRIRLIESETGEEMTASNYIQKAVALRGRRNHGRRAGTRYHVLDSTINQPPAFAPVPPFSPLAHFT